jgi:hypothetical protein
MAKSSMVKENNMLIITKDTEKLITIVEGTGDNLTDEDIKDGYTDYVMTSIYRVEGEDIVLEDSGQMLSQTPIEDLEEDELVRRVLDYWGLGEEDWLKGVM